MAATASRRITALKETMTKTQLLDALSESTGLQRKDVASVLDQLGAVIERHVKRRAVGTFTLPDLLKIKVVRKPATKARKMMSPFTGQEITVAAKPASRAVKVQPLSLRDIPLFLAMPFSPLPVDAAPQKTTTAPIFIGAVALITLFGSEDPGSKHLSKSW